MKTIWIIIAILLIPALTLMGKREAMVPEDLQPKTGMVICLGEEVGDTIDLKERNHYRLFLTSKNFHSAVILQLTGKEHYVVQITQKQSGEGQYRQATLPMDKSTLKKLRRYIHYFDKLVPAARDRLFTREDSAVLGFEKSTKPVSENLSRRKETLGKTKISEAMVWKLEEQAKILAKEKWSKERWREEMLNDRGGNYRLAGGDTWWYPWISYRYADRKGIAGEKSSQAGNTPRRFVFRPFLV